MHCCVQLGPEGSQACVEDKDRLVQAADPCPHPPPKSFLLVMAEQRRLSPSPDRTLCCRGEGDGVCSLHNGIADSVSWQLIETGVVLSVGE